MHIHDFHSKLTSGNEEGHLFEALRRLSQVEDPQAMYAGDSDATTSSNWPSWPAMDSHSSCAASSGI
jgi:hypothetical protein